MASFDGELSFYYMLSRRLVVRVVVARRLGYRFGIYNTYMDVIFGEIYKGSLYNVLNTLFFQI